jgi:uncharacterized membrane protein YqjE
VSSGLNAVKWLHRLHSVALTVLIVIGLTAAHSWPSRIALVVAFVVAVASEAWTFGDARDYAQEQQR